jgi:hypothetical protein
MNERALWDSLQKYEFSGDTGGAGGDDTPGEDTPGDDTPPEQNDIPKRCCKCKTLKSLAEFNIDCTRSDGRGTQCKECRKMYNRTYYAKRKREDAQDEDEDAQDEDAPAPEPGPGDLYVMQNSRIPGELKIGRSQCVENRRLSLQRSQNYRMLVLAVFPQAGNIEGCVHQMLSYCRVTEEAAGREWFRCSLQTAFAAIGQTLGESRFAETSAGSSA